MQPARQRPRKLSPLKGRLEDMTTAAPAHPLARFSPATREWFTTSFEAPTAAQAGAWQAISSGSDTLVIAPTGSGKTLAAFLAAIDELVSTPTPADELARCRVLYISPLKALAVDVQRNLRAPLAGIGHTAARLELSISPVQVGIRTGDTPPQERRQQASHPPDVLITTPESLFLLLTSAARASLAGIRTVILDEVHALASTKRGAHLSLSLERLDALLPQRAQRIGLSATVRPAEEVARYLSGASEQAVAIVNPPSTKQFDLQVVVPVADLTQLGASTPATASPLPHAGPAAGASPSAPSGPSLWPHVEERISALISSQRCSLVFANSRRLAERLCTRLNELAADRAAAAEPGQADELTPEGAPPVVARAHHGSVSKQQRADIEDQLKAGILPAVVATSSLELGIDMGAVDQVIQVEAPPSVASGLQRIGRAGHSVGQVSKGVLFPKSRADLIPTAVVVQRMRAGLIEHLVVPRNPLDVLAQQIVAMTALDPWGVEDLFALVRRSANYSTLTRPVFEAVLDMLAGRYPSQDFAELRPRLVWDRASATLTARPGAQRLAVTSGGTIPDRGLFGVFLAGSGSESGSGSGPGSRQPRRVGELDEEMVYESRVGDVFTLGTSTWRIEEITRDQVLVSPAPGQPAKLPFWKGDTLGRPLELGRAVGQFVASLGALTPQQAMEQVRDSGLDQWAAENLLRYVQAQREATGHVPDHQTLVVERCRDEIGDWRVVIHSPFGAAVHAPWALAIAARIRQRYGLDAAVMHADDGIVLRLPDSEHVGLGELGGLGEAGEASPSYLGDLPSSHDLAELLRFEPDQIEAIVTEEVAASALFAARFRECAARALLLPRRNPGRRTPLWQQRQRSAQLLAVASQYPSFPIVLETMRECLVDVFDLPGLRELLSQIASRTIRLVEVSTPTPSPFAQSLLFGYVAHYLYEGDSPLAERRAAALTLDPHLLGDLLGSDGYSLADLLDPAAVEQVHAQLQWLTQARRLRDEEAVADAVRVLGPLCQQELLDRGATVQHLQILLDAHRLLLVRIGGQQQYAAVEDAGLLRDGLGIPLPMGVPLAFAEPTTGAVRQLLTRYARTRGPFTAASAAQRLGLGTSVVLDVLQGLASSGQVISGQFLPEGMPLPGGQPSSGPQWCHAEVVQRLRRASLASLRQQIEAVPAQVLPAFTTAWQQVQPVPHPRPPGSRPQPSRSGLRGVEGVASVIEQLQGVALVASDLETLILPSRVPDYTPAMLDELTASGELTWVGAGSLPGEDGYLCVALASAAPLLLPPPAPREFSLLEQAILDVLPPGAAMFFPALLSNVQTHSQAREQPSVSQSDVGQAVWDLVWSGWLTNDTLAPVRALRAGTSRASRTPRAPRAAHRPVRLRYSRPGLATSCAASPVPTVAGRWSLPPAREPDPTRRWAALAQVMMERHGVVTRGAVVAEDPPGGFAALYRVLAAMEESGHCRRGYLVEGLGASQFATAGAIDRLRAIATQTQQAQELAQACAGLPEAWRAPTPSGLTPGLPSGHSSDPAVFVLAATDPAQPFGAALPWPALSQDCPTGHKPGRKAGAVVVLVGPQLVFYLERGGKSLLAYSDQPPLLAAALQALADCVRSHRLPSLTLERLNGQPLLGHSLSPLVESAGFTPTPRGLRLRG